MRTSHVDRAAAVLRIALLAASLPLVVCLDAHAQAPAAAVDPAFEAAKRAWDALPEADRRAIQDGLIWTGDYKGLVDGEFGRGTRAAIIAYAQRSGLPTDGTLEQRGRSMLAATSAQARTAVGFMPVRDPKTGAMLGLPTKLLPRRTDTAQGSRWASADSAMVVETTTYSPTVGDLPQIFDALKESTPQRKVTYRLLRPDFLVVSGEIGRSVFYTRIARPPTDQPGSLRGFTMTYPAGNKSFENLSIAIANGWAAFPAPGPAPTSPQAAGPGGSAPLPPIAPRPPSGPVLTATGVAVAADKVLTLYGQCNEPRIAGRAAAVLKRDDTTGATLLQVAGLNARPAALAMSASAEGHALAVFLTRKGASDVEAAVAPGEVMPASGPAQRRRLLAPVQGEGQGGPVFDRAGAFIGLVGKGDGLRRVAGIVPQKAWPLVDAAALASLLSAASVTLPAASAPQTERSAGDIAAAARQSLFPVLCTP